MTKQMDSAAGKSVPHAHRIVPDSRWLSRRLTEFLFGAPSTMAIYVAGLFVASVFMWRRSSDDTIVAATIIALVLACYRAAVLSAFRRSRSGPAAGDDSSYVWMYCAGAWLYSLDLAALLLRAVSVGELLPIVMSIVMVVGYLVGLIRRAAVVRFAIPSMLLLFVPMIVGGAAADDGDYLVIAILLLLLCLACVRYAVEARGTIIAQLSAEHRLSEMVGRDPLTGLANRAGLEAYIDANRMAVDRRCRPFDLAVFDLDGFKSVNDTYGHAAGDELLQQVADRLRSALASRHFAARLGGDEFVVVFDCHIEEAECASVCNVIVDALRSRFDIAGVSVAITTSLGLARSPRGCSGFEETFDRADKALYTAKKLGRDRMHVADRCAPPRIDDHTPRAADDGTFSARLPDPARPPRRTTSA